MPEFPLLLFDFADAQGRPQRLCFREPVQVIAAHTSAEVRPALDVVAAAARAGRYAAGFVAYEAAPAFEPAFRVHPPTNDLPLLWFGIFDAPQPAPAFAPGPFALSEWQPTVSRPAYAAAIGAVREAIARGDTYQANYTMRLRAQFSGDDLAFYEQLRAAQAASYSAYLNLGRYRILSASPELFFHWDGAQLTSRPMKGTAPRGRWPAEDEELAAWLAASEKNRAENLMIVDLLRNDIGRVAQVGSVAVPALFAIERYRTVHQMTSTITAQTRPGTDLAGLFGALFPCGSITGAPKIETMKLLAELEDTPRGVYCGAIGLVAPGGSATFNVAIRTVTLDMESGAAEYGVGGGITWDSTAADEYAEALLKAAPLRERWPAFALLETLRLPMTWLGILLFFVYTGAEVGVGNWVFSLLTEERGVSTEIAGTWVSLYWASLTLGRIVFGVVVGRVSPTTLLRGSMIAAAVGALMIWLNFANWLTFGGIALMGIAFAPQFPLLISATPGFLGARHADNGVGLEVASASVGGALLPSLIGVLAAAYGLEVLGPSLLVMTLAMAGLFELLARRMR